MSSESKERAPAILAEDLRIEAQGRILVGSGGIRIEHGELCLLVGASGTGKSVTLSLLCGLLRSTEQLKVEGRIQVLGTDVLQRDDHAGIPGTGIVFQDFALLDDVDTVENVRLGLDHAGKKSADADAAARSLLKELGLPAGVAPARLSGGMKQRLALARVLAFDPELVFYDEPTSGLDPAMKRQVAELIRTVHDRRKMTSVIVTHDLHTLLGIADRVLLLDPSQRTWRAVPPEGVDDALEALRGFKLAEPDLAPKRFTIQMRIHDFLESSGDFVLAAGRTILALVPRFPSGRWGRKFLLRFLRLTSLGSALPFLGLSGLIAGFVTSYFMFSLLPVREYTEPVLEEEFIGSLGFALYRVVIPGVVTLLFASRSGAALAADLGNRVLTRQVDALRSHGIPPERYLLTNVALASLAGIPLLFIVSYVLARIAATGVFLATHPGFGAIAFQSEFQRLLGGSMFWPGGSGYVLAKILLCALGSASIAAHVGLRPKLSGTAVAEGVTSAIIRATIYVLIVHLIFAFFEF